MNYIKKNQREKLEKLGMDKYKKITSPKKIHSILTYKVRTTKGVEGGCINRDNNATINMLKIVKRIIKKEDLGVFSRKKKEVITSLK